jgi:hypothetical protein
LNDFHKVEVKMKRREFLKQTATVAATLGCFSATLSALDRENNRGQIERRALNQTGEKQLTGQPAASLAYTDWWHHGGINE